MSAPHPSKVAFAVVMGCRLWAADERLTHATRTSAGRVWTRSLRHGATDRRTRILDTVKYSAPTAPRGGIEKPV